MKTVKHNISFNVSFHLNYVLKKKTGHYQIIPTAQCSLTCLIFILQAETAAKFLVYLQSTTI